MSRKDQPPPPIPTASFDPSRVRTVRQVERATQRREIATALLAGLCANSAAAHVRLSVAVDKAVEAADMLIERLGADR